MNYMLRIIIHICVMYSRFMVILPCLCECIRRGGYNKNQQWSSAQTRVAIKKSCFGMVPVPEQNFTFTKCSEMTGYSSQVTGLGFSCQELQAKSFTWKMYGKVGVQPVHSGIG
jgi:hypothetical protein